VLAPRPHQQNPTLKTSLVATNSSLFLLCTSVVYVLTYTVTSTHLFRPYKPSLTVQLTEHAADVLDSELGHELRAVHLVRLSSAEGQSYVARR